MRSTILLRMWSAENFPFRGKFSEVLDSLDDCINDINKLCHQLEVPEDVKLNLFLNGLTEKLQRSLKIRHPRNFTDAVNFASLKDSVATTKNHGIAQHLQQMMDQTGNYRAVEDTESLTMESLKEEITAIKGILNQKAHGHTVGTVTAFQHSVTGPQQQWHGPNQVAELFHNPTEATREINWLKEENRRLQKRDYQQYRNPFPTNRRHLRTQYGEVICSNCLREIVQNPTSSTMARSTQFQYRLVDHSNTSVKVIPISEGHIKKIMIADMIMNQITKEEPYQIDRIRMFPPKNRIET